MGKRLQRISGKNINGLRSQLVNIELHIVLLNGSSFHGTIEKWNDNECYFKDFRNHTQRIAIAQIDEIVTDQLASY